MIKEDWIKNYDPTTKGIETSSKETKIEEDAGIYTDMKARWRSFELIDEIVRHDLSRVIPGHEPLVFQKERYP